MARRDRWGMLALEAIGRMIERRGSLVMADRLHPAALEAARAEGRAVRLDEAVEVVILEGLEVCAVALCGRLTVPGVGAEVAPQSEDARQNFGLGDL